MLEVKRIYEENANQQLLYFLDAATFLHLGISLMFRISYDKSANLKQELQRNKQYLDENFPTWNTNKIISTINAKKDGGVLKKANLARKIYRSVFMELALCIYRFMIRRLNWDIKW